MCDTIGRIINARYAIFGKNSDRAVNEPQVVEFYPARDYKEPTTLKCTYISIPQINHTNSIILSRPTWMWGGEMGVNEFGVVIGNEAVFTKGKYGKESLIGMDYLRLGLERGNTAKEALEVIINLLQKYDQGGNCGYDSKFEYNNAFLIMDRKEIYVLETKGKEYVYKKTNNYSISNCLSIHEEGDFYSNKCDFTKKYSDFVMTFGSQGRKRREQTSCANVNNIYDMINVLSSHNTDNPFKKGSVSSVCMHASNSLTGDQTTNSMIVELMDNDINILITGCSLPCVSFYKPHIFKQGGLIFNHEVGNDAYWIEHELFNRKFLSKEVSKEYHEERLKVQKEILENGYLKIDESLQLEKEFMEKYSKVEMKTLISGPIYKSFWKQKNVTFNKK